MAGPTPLHLDQPAWRLLLERLGPSLGLWRAAEVAALREQRFAPPVLDLGCGDGLVSSLALPQGVLGADLNISVLTQARGRHGPWLYAAAGQALPLRGGSVWTVVSNSVLEHIGPLDAVLAELARVLQPDGSLVFTVPSEAFSGWLALPLPRYQRWRNCQLQHLNLWPAPRWAQHLEQAGLRLETVRPYLRRPLVVLWDALELLQQPAIGRRRVFGRAWRRLPSRMLERMAGWACRLDLAASGASGGLLMVARKG